MSDHALPRDNLVRAQLPGCELRSSDTDGGMPTLYGHFLKFDRWTEINSWFEGHFMERIAPGALKKTIGENRDRIRCLFQHGRDPQVGDKPLGQIEDLREDDEGGYYEVPLFDTSYNRDLVPGLEARTYGASFAFQVIREELDEEPSRSEHNPDGLPERTIKEIRLYEFGPVTFPAYSDATAGVRSMTDELVFGDIARNPQRFRDLLAVDLSSLSRDRDDAPPEEAAAQDDDPEHRDDGRRDTSDLYGLPAGKDTPSWQL